MKQVLLATFFVLGMTNFAMAEDFVCQGTGKFSKVTQQQVHLDWEKAYQKVPLKIW